MDTARPFAGIEVVEFGQFIAVPFCAQVLSEGGAHVIKIESVEGDPVRQLAPLAPGETRHFLSRNRGKHSLPLDLRHPSAARVVERLLARADVVLTNFRPGLAAELGLDWPSLAPRFPRLVVGNVSAFGGRGPAARLAGMDLVVQARSGLLAAGGGVSDGVPTGGENPVVDYMCAMTLAFGIASALLRRAQHGARRRGGRLAPDGRARDPEQQHGARRVGGRARPTPPCASGSPSCARAGRPYSEQAALTPQIRPPGIRQRLLPHLRDQGRRARRRVRQPGAPARLHARGRAQRRRARPADRRPGQRSSTTWRFAGGCEAIVATRTTAEWKAMLEAAGVPAAGVKLPLELLDDEQPLANGMLHDLTHPVLGPVRVLAPPVQWTAADSWPAPATAPFGSETRAILGELGFSTDDVETLLAEGVTRDRLRR